MYGSLPLRHSIGYRRRLMKLTPRYVEKPWGRLQLPRFFTPPPGQRIGEVWFEGSPDLPLLAKYLFTSERLSVQVHPSDQQARARGLPSGKSECWAIIDAAPGATLGLGLIRDVSEDELRAAAIDGSILELIHWRPVAAGDFLLVPAGTIHAIGGGISLLEFQQNADVTYRLFDYGRPRPLHVDDAVAVACRRPYPDAFASRLPDSGDHVLVDGDPFRLVQASKDALAGSTRWVLPLEGEVRSGGDRAGPGECLLLGPDDTLDTGGARVLIGAIA
jgi:mannose-6-phosphate isomerase